MKRIVIVIISLVWVSYSSVALGSDSDVADTADDKDAVCDNCKLHFLQRLEELVNDKYPFWEGEKESKKEYCLEYGIPWAPKHYADIYIVDTIPNKDIRYYFKDDMPSFAVRGDVDILSLDKDNILDYRNVFIISYEALGLIYGWNEEVEAALFNIPAKNFRHGVPKGRRTINKNITECFFMIQPSGFIIALVEGKLVPDISHTRYDFNPSAYYKCLIPYMNNPEEWDDYIYVGL